MKTVTLDQLLFEALETPVEEVTPEYLEGLRREAQEIIARKRNKHVKTVTAMLIAPVLLYTAPALADGGGDDQAAAESQRDFTTGPSGISSSQSGANSSSSSSSCCIEGWNESLNGDSTVFGMNPNRPPSQHNTSYVTTSSGRN
jgi:hypothetical protein